MAFASRLLTRVAQSAATLAAGLALAGLAQAQLVGLTANLTGTQEVPANASPGTGLACCTFDPSSNTLSWNITFSGLVGPESAAHFHTGNVGVAGPVIIPLPLGSPKTGSAVLTAAQATALLASGIYVNIHTNVFPGGEIRGQVIPIPAPTAFCFGDGSSGPCPCGNNSTPGNNEGCLHSAGFGGKLKGTGGSSIACDSLQLCASQLLGNTAIFIQGSTSPFGPVNFGDGVRCIGGTLKRVAVTGINGGGVCFGNSGTPPISSAGGITSPGTYGYQVYFRDPAAFCTAFTYNITNAVQVTWVP